MLLKLRQYQLEVTHTPVKEMYIADMLSGAVNSNQNAPVDEGRYTVFAVAEETPFQKQLR